MLQNLHVKNLALIDEAEVDFSAGLNILSGETGAGKSIIIGSINLALGEKVPKEMLRENDKPAYVELVFSVSEERILSKLREYDIECDDGTVILSRKISGGRAVARVNGEAVSANVLKEIAGLLIDIHGQHEHQSLLNKKNHLEILDAYIGDSFAEQKQKLKSTYQKYKKLQDEYEHASIDITEQKRELSLLEYEIQELEEANLIPGEDEELEKEYRRFSNGKKIMEAVGLSYSATGGDEESASERIGRAVRELSMVSSYDSKVSDLENQLAEIENLLSDFNHEICAYMDDTDFNESHFYEIEKRLDLLNHLKSKYGHTIEEILSSLEEKKARVEVLNDYDSYLINLQAELDSKKKELDILCDQISTVRKQKSLVLTSVVKQALLDLNFLDVQFEMHFDLLDHYTANGTDDAEFLISTNPGESLKPLGKIASGGELSRIMLAIKTVMADADVIETLIFDEIDSGISGRTAQMVSEKMNVLGKNHQIICITHLPQIAAMADTHFLIEKKVSDGTTYSYIHKLTEEESVNELARMLGGVEITETVRNSAFEMKALAKSKK